MFIKIEISFNSDKTQKEVKEEIDKILLLSKYTQKYNIEFREETGK